MEKYLVELTEDDLMVIFHSLLTEKDRAFKDAEEFKGSRLTEEEKTTFKTKSVGPGNYGTANMLVYAEEVHELYNKLEEKTFVYI